MSCACTQPECEGSHARQESAEDRVRCCRPYTEISERISRAQPTLMDRVVGDAHLHQHYVSDAVMDGKYSCAFILLDLLYPPNLGVLDPRGSLVHDAGRGDGHLPRHAPARGAGGINLLHERHAVRDLAEDDVLAVEPECGDGRDEELSCC
jgi:hypothetical protein